jgi:hypothetical protein
MPKQIAPQPNAAPLFDNDSGLFTAFDKRELVPDHAERKPSKAP